MEVQIAVSKVNKYAVSESGDTFEVVERPGGGVSIVLADGQTSGRGAKAVSMMVVRKVISLLAEGVRDGAAARAASDYLFNEKQGKVSSTLNIVSIDLESKTIVLTRNNESPIFIISNERVDQLHDPSRSIGTARNTKPVITEIPFEDNLVIVLFTDGMVHAGSRTGSSIDIATTLLGFSDDDEITPQEISDSLLAQAVRVDQGRPCDDISVVCVKINANRSDNVRRMSVRLPISVQLPE